MDMARVAAIRDLESGREQLIRAEKALKDARNRITTLNNALIASAHRFNTAPEWEKYRRMVQRSRPRSAQGMERNVYLYRRQACRL